MIKAAYKALILIAVMLFSLPAIGQEQGNNNKEEFDMASMIMDHIKDAHEWHLLSYTDKNGNEKDVAIYFPVILFDNGIKVFSSKKLYHDGTVVSVTTPKGEKKQVYINTELDYGIYNEKIYKLEGQQQLSFGEDGLVLNEKPLDFSITKNVFIAIFSAVLILLLLVASARSYKGEGRAPRGIARFIEPVVIFIRDDVARPNIGEAKYEKYLPYLLTVFFFILINNLLGKIPFFPGGGNLTGNIAFTMVLSIFTLLITIFSGNKHYWGHIFAMPGVPKALLIIMIPIEIIGIFTKPFALTVRLFANMTAGHILGLALIGLIFALSVGWAGLAIPMGIFMSVLEVLVCFLQAYIFTILSALFIGEAVAEGH